MKPLIGVLPNGDKLEFLEEISLNNKQDAVSTPEDIYQLLGDERAQILNYLLSISI